MRDKESRKCSMCGLVVRSPKRAALHIALKHRDMVIGVNTSDLPEIVGLVFPEGGA